MSANKKIEEGNEHVKSAEKSMKTSLLKWRPDYENAADEYNKAATCFRNAKALEQCKDCLLKAAECHKQNRALFYAAKALDQCVLICKEMGQFQEIPALAERAANMFQSHGSAESAAASLDKAAKIVESQHPADALKLYLHAADIAGVQDSSRQVAEYTSKVARLYVKLKQYDQAVQAIKKELNIYQELGSQQAAGRMVVALVLVEIARGDVIAAEKAFREYGGNCDAPEVQNLTMLLQAYDEEDRDNAKLALSNPFIMHMDVEYAILARGMPLPKVTEVPNTREKGDGQSEEAQIQNEEDEYESGGLC